MSSVLTVKLGRTIKSLKVIETSTAGVDLAALSDLQDEGESSGLTELESEKQHYAKALQMLEAVATKLQLVYERAVIEHRQGIAKLSVEIARKILAQKVKDGDYQTESIIQEALNNAPTRQDIVVRLNPQDLSRLQQTQQQGDGVFAGVKFVADADIGPAQCVIDTPKGKVESLIDEHLEQVGRALTKAV